VPPGAAGDADVAAGFWAAGDAVTGGTAPAAAAGPDVNAGVAAGGEEVPTVLTPGGVPVPGPPVPPVGITGPPCLGSGLALLTACCAAAM
jgi:hypothetical protein